MRIIKYTLKSKFFLFLSLLFLMPVLRAQEGPLSVETDEERAQDLYLEGLQRQLAGDYAQAAERYEQALAINPRLVGALYQLSNYGHYMHNDSLALDMMERAVGIDQDNYWLKQSLVSLYITQKRDDEAIRLLEDMARQYPAKTDVLLMLVDMHKLREDYAGVVKTLDRLELLEGKSESLSMEKFRNYMLMKDEKHAFAEMQSLAEEYPNDVRYRVLMGDVYQDNGHMADAYRVYKEVERDHPDNLNLLISLSSFYASTGQDSLFKATFEQLVVSPRLDEDVRVGFMQNIIIRNLQEEGDTSFIMPLLHKILALPQHDARMAELCVRYQITKEAPQEAVKPVLEQLLAIDPEAEQARGQLLSYAVQNEDVDEIIRLCRTAVDYHSPDPVYYYYLGLAYFQQKEDELALQAFEQGLTKVNDKGNLTIITNMYAICGDIHHRMGNDEKAFQAYDSCLVYQPDDALVLNNYAYYLSLKKQQLKRAEEMSSRSLQESPGNPTYLDTYAWILFQQKRYEEARVAIDSVLVALGDSVTAEDVNLIEHAGDIYARCGQKERAVELWNQALELSQQESDGTVGLTDTEKLKIKIRKKKYVE